MIETIKHKGLAQYFFKGKPGKLNSAQRTRIKYRLEILDAATKIEDINLPGLRLHQLEGNVKGKPVVYAINVSGNWRLTFEFIDGDVYQLDLVDPH